MINPSEIKRILVLKLCCQGDVIHLTPIIDSLKINFPDAEIEFITSGWTIKTVKLFRNINKVIEIDYDLDKPYIKQFGFFWKLYRTIKKGNYDLVFLAHRNNIYGIIIRLCGIKYRLGFSKTKFLNYTADFNDNLHEAKRYQEILKKNGLISLNRTPEINLPVNNQELKSNYIKDNNSIVIGIYPFGGVNPGTNMKIKRWDLENYLNLSENIHKDYNNAKIIIFEGKLNDEKISRSVLNKRIIVTDDFDVISICNLFITNDTGALHIAAAFGIPTLSLFGPTDPTILAPINNDKEPTKHRYIWKKPECSPCWTTETSIDRQNTKYWKGIEFCCYIGTIECMKNISLNEVYENVNSMIKEKLI